MLTDFQKNFTRGLSIV